MADLERGIPPGVDDENLDREPSNEELTLLEFDDDDAAGLYLRDQRQTPFLTPAQEIELGKRIQKGKYTTDQHLIDDAQAAREAFANANTRLVVSIAKRYKGQGLQFRDVIGNGNVGLMKAIDKFDPDRGFRFSTLAAWWIRQAISRGLADQARTIRIPVNIGDQIRRMVKEAKQLEQDLGRSPTCEEIAEVMELSVETVQFILDVRRPPVSLDEPVGEEGENEFGDILADPDAVEIEESVDKQLLKEVLADEMARLSDEERFVLTKRFGLDGDGEYTLRELARALGRSSEWIRRLEGKAIQQLRHPAQAEKLWNYFIEE